MEGEMRRSRNMEGNEELEEGRGAWKREVRSRSNRKMKMVKEQKKRIWRREMRRRRRKRSTEEGNRYGETET